MGKPSFMINKRIRNTLKYAVDNIPEYKSKYKSISNDFNTYTLEDFRKIPFLVKAELKDSNPYRFVNLKIKDQIVSVHTTSGSTGIPIYTFYTPKDWTSALESIAKGFDQMGVNKYHRIVQAFPNGMPSAGSINEESLKYFNKKMVINIGVGKNTYQLFKIALTKFKAEVFMGTPSTLIINGKKLQDDLGHSNNTIKMAVLIGESLKETQRTVIKELFGDIDLKVALGQTEMHTILANCPYCPENAIHLENDLLFHEFLKNNGEHAKKGESGEHVITSLSFEAQPLIRYRTGDWMQLIGNAGTCKCGNRNQLVSLPTRRNDKFIKIKGILIDPQVIYNTLTQVIKKPFVDYQLEISTRHAQDFAYLKILVTEEKNLPPDLDSHINGLLKSAIGIHLNEILFTSDRDRLVEGCYKIKNLLDKRT